MYIAVDAWYDGHQGATATAIVFERWEAAETIAEYKARIEDVQPYVAGEFYRRELPCILSAMEHVKEPIDLIVIDGYVMLGQKPGLGIRLWEVLAQKTPIIGVAKTEFRGARAIELYRGRSRRPLYVTAVGIDSTAAADCAGRMHGKSRIPTLLAKLDRLTRN